MVNLLGRIERLLEDAVEGTSRRLFRAQLQPVELAKAATRVMQSHQVVGPEGPEVPNWYRIRVHPTDFETFAPYRISLQLKLERYVQQFAEDRGLRPVAGWRVELASDELVRPRAVLVDAWMADVDESSGVTQSATGSTGPGHPHSRSSTSGSAMPPAAAATIVTEDGRELTLAGEQTSFGRALDNDVVIGDSRVSRYHAQVRRVGADYVVRDLGSTNGTAVAGKAITEQGLREGDEISLGGFKIVLRFSSS